jgi:hypothetical protein
MRVAATSQEAERSGSHGFPYGGGGLVAPAIVTPGPANSVGRTPEFAQSAQVTRLYKTNAVIQVCCDGACTATMANI